MSNVSASLYWGRAADQTPRISAMEPTATLPPQPPGTDGAAQELELWWGGYAARTMIPSLLFCLLLTVCVVGTAAYISTVATPRGSTARWWAYHLTLVIWLWQCVRWAYRVAGYEFRLTNRRLFCGWGPLVTSPPPVALPAVKNVHVMQSKLERWLGVGEVVVETNAATTLVLSGVYGPHAVAERIRRAAACHPVPDTVPPA